MNMIDFGKCERNTCYYGGQAGEKYGIVYNDKDYLLKFPRNMKEMKTKFPVSYGNNAFSEFLGSHFYEFMGIPVHETILGYSGKHYVVACKDFCLENNSVLYEFNKMANAFLTDGNLKNRSSVTSSGEVLLSDILLVMNTLQPLENIRSELKKRFWEMFVVDALIANPDRNSGNWGLLKPAWSRKAEDLILAPVYDNGNSLHCKAASEVIRHYLNGSEDDRNHFAFQTLSIFTRIDKTGEQKRINGTNFLVRRMNEDCSKTLMNLKDRIPDAIKQFDSLVDEIPVLSSEQRAFYKDSVSRRYEKGILKAVREIQEKGLCSGEILDCVIPPDKSMTR